MRLSAPALDAQQEVRFAEVEAPSGNSVLVESYTALLIRWR